MNTGLRPHASRGSATRWSSTSILGDFGLPVVIKRIEGWTPDSRGVPSVSVARTRERAHEIVSLQPDNFLLQEYIPGSSATSWMFNGYFDHESRCLFGATGYKIRQYPVSGGFTTLGQLTANHELQAEIVRFLGAVGTAASSISACGSTRGTEATSSST